MAKSASQPPNQVPSSPAAKKDSEPTQPSASGEFTPTDDQDTANESKQPTAAPEQPQGNSPKADKVATHKLSENEALLFAEVHQSFERQRVAIARFLSEKYGYPVNEPYAFQFDWQTRVVIVYKVKNDTTPSALPAQG